MAEERKLTDYASQTFDKLRYGDTDRQGHVNNAVFATLFETGRIHLMYDPKNPFVEPGSNFVIARIAIDFKREIYWPGRIDIGTSVISVGRSSMVLEQALFQDERCVAIAEGVMVLMDEATRRSRPLPPKIVERLMALRSKQV